MVKLPCYAISRAKRIAASIARTKETRDCTSLVMDASDSSQLGSVCIDQ